MADLDEVVSSPVLNEDEISNANTEDSLLGSRKSTETISSVARIEEVKCCHLDQDKAGWGPNCTLLVGISLTVFGMLTIIWTPFVILMNERLNMNPLFPPYQLWKNPPDEVLLRVYVFNITNSEEFLSGNHTKLRLEEVGPIVYREKLEHYNVTFNENGTLSYVAKRTAIFLPDMNTIDLNDSIVVPNLALLGMASYLWDSAFFTKMGFNMLVRNMDTEPITRMSINDYLWNNSDPLLETARNLVPYLVPVTNMGILSRIYSNFENSVTVYIGQDNGHEKFFLIDKYDGTEYLPGYGESCQDTVINSTEGVTYAQFLTKESVLRYWRNTMCRVTPLYFEKEVPKYGVTAYKFSLPNYTYDRTQPSDEDCYRGYPMLASGLSDVSKCFYNFPMAASFPHFLYGDAVLKTYVDGLSPAPEKHDSFVIVEPITGIPINSRARSQSNLVIRKLAGFNDAVNKFSDLILPMFWAEYNQVGLPLYISALMYFTVEVVPRFQGVFSAFLILVGTLLSFYSARKIRKRRGHFRENQLAQFEKEQESFIKK